MHGSPVVPPLREVCLVQQLDVGESVVDDVALAGEEEEYDDEQEGVVPRTGLGVVGVRHFLSFVIILCTRMLSIRALPIL